MTKNAESRRNLHTHTHTHTDSFLKSLKQIGTICFLFLISISPTFADDEPTLIPTPASCNNSVLNTTEGSAALEAIYTANTIGTTWYSDGVQLEVDNAATSCTYDREMTLPTNPTKPGYEFNGWKIRIPCNIPSTDVSNNGNAYGYKDDSTGEYGADSSNTGTFNLTEDNTWGGSWSNGDKVTGEAFCSTTNDGKRFAQIGNPGTVGGYAAGGQYCWCRATHYTANNAQQCSLSSPSWVFFNDGGSAVDCAGYCASNCAHRVQDNSAFRAAVFTGLIAQ